MTTFPSATAAAVRRRPRRWVALVALLALLIAEAMNLLDATIVQVAGPAIHADLGGRRADIQWYSTAYTLPFAMLLITGGRLGDRFGRRRVFRVGISVFVLASLGCALAPAPSVLIGLRAVQGAAAALVIPQTFGLIKAMFTGRDTAAALGTIGPTMGLAAVSGPVLGAVLTSAWTWRSVFLVNVPLGIVVLSLTLFLVEDRVPGPSRFDALWTLLGATGTALIIYPLIGTLSPLGWALLAAGFVLLSAYTLRLRFPSRGFPVALLTSLLFFGATTGLTLVVVLHLRLALGKSTLDAGLTLLPWSLGLGVASLFTGSWLVPRLGAARLLRPGLALLVLGLLGCLVLPSVLLLSLAVIGLGGGLFTTSFFTAALQPVLPEDNGLAAGQLNAAQQLGATLGVATMGRAYLHTNHLTAPVLLAIVVVILLMLLRVSDRSCKHCRSPASGAAASARFQRAGLRHSHAPPVAQ